MELDFSHNNSPESHWLAKAMYNRLLQKKQSTVNPIGQTPDSVEYAQYSVDDVVYHYLVTQRLAWRLSAYSWSLFALLALAVVGIVELTQDGHQTGPLYTVFGYENLCVVFDNSPGRAIVAALFFLTVFWPVLRCLVVDAWLVWNFRPPSSSPLYGWRLLFLVAIALWLLFPTTFVMHPDETDAGVTWHTLPFLGLIVVFGLMALYDPFLVFPPRRRQKEAEGAKEAGKEEEKCLLAKPLPSPPRTRSTLKTPQLVVLGLVGLVTIVKLVVTIGSLAKGSPFVHGTVGRAIDIGWTVVVIPSGFVFAVLKYCRGY